MLVVPAWGCPHEHVTTPLAQRGFTVLGFKSGQAYFSAEV
jgi:hypothetical protein